MSNPINILHTHGEIYYGIWYVIGIAALAGIGSSLLGGLIAITIKKPTPKLIGIGFAFASAVLLTLVFVDLIPHAIGSNGCCADGAGLWFTLLGFLLGIGFVFLLDYLDRIGHAHAHDMIDLDDPQNDKDEDDFMSKKGKKHLLRTAFIVMFAIMLHDFPKGFAIGASGSIVMAAIIVAGCLPESIAVATPFKAGGMKWYKILALCVGLGLSTVLGAIIGYYVGSINALAEGLMFAIAAGCIVGVIFLEMLPLSYKYLNNKMIHTLVMIIGIILMLILNYYLHDYLH